MGGIEPYAGALSDIYDDDVSGDNLGSSRAINSAEI